VSYRGATSRLKNHHTVYLILIGIISNIQRNVQGDNEWIVIGGRLRGPL
jgi:hypothetical protein